MYSRHQHEPTFRRGRHWIAWAYFRSVAAILTAILITYLFAALKLNWNLSDIRIGRGVDLDAQTAESLIQAQASEIWGVSVDAPAYVTFAEFVVTRLVHPLGVLFLLSGALVAAVLSWRVKRGRAK